MEEEIRPTGFYHNKAKSIIRCGQGIVEKFSGEVPRTLEELTSLAGVGRKTANIILGNAFGQQAIAVDTHVKRVTHRLGWAKSDDPDKIEFELMEVIPQDRWTLACHQLVFHGRNICVAKKPKCPYCPVTNFVRRLGLDAKGIMGGRMFLRQFEVGNFAVFAYLLGEEGGGTGLVIDPAGEADPIMALADQKKITIQYILNTHAHVDHVMGNEEMKQKTGAQIIIHEKDAPRSNPHSQSMLSMFGGRPSPPADRTVKDGDLIQVGSLALQVLHTPGHSPGGMCLIWMVWSLPAIPYSSGG